MNRLHRGPALDKHGFALSNPKAHICKYCCSSPDCERTIGSLKERKRERHKGNLTKTLGFFIPANLSWFEEQVKTGKQGLMSVIMECRNISYL